MVPPLTRNESETPKRARPCVLHRGLIQAWCACVEFTTQSNPPVTPYYPANWSGFEASWNGTTRNGRVYCLCSVVLWLFSPLLGCPNDHTVHTKISLSNRNLRVCLLVLRARPILKHSILFLFESLRQSDQYTLFANQLYYILSIFCFIRSCSAACFIASIRNYYCCMFVSASTAVPMHTCQPYP